MLAEVRQKGSTWEAIRGEACDPPTTESGTTATTRPGCDRGVERLVGHWPRGVGRCRRSTCSRNTLIILAMPHSRGGGRGPVAVRRLGRRAAKQGVDANRRSTCTSRRRGGSGRTSRRSCGPPGAGEGARRRGSVHKVDLKRTIGSAAHSEHQLSAIRAELHQQPRFRTEQLDELASTAAESVAR